MSKQKMVKIGIKNRYKKPSKEKKQISLPNEEVLRKIALSLKRKLDKEERKTRYAPIKQILTMLTIGTGLAIVIVMPGTAPLFKSLVEKENQNWDDWKKFNLSYLRRNLERLKKQKLVEIDQKDGQTIIKITKAGKRKVLRYALDELEIPETKFWDGKWRMVIYDIPTNKRYLSDLLNQTLKNLGFLSLQKSVFLIPYPCQPQIEFLREYFNLGENVIVVEVNKIEDDKPFREYFGL